MSTAEQWILRRRFSPRFFKSVSHVPPIVARVLYARHLDDPAAVETFLDPGGVSLQSPDALPDLAPAVTRITQAIGHGEPIAVYGDYDCDGVTATTLLVSALRRMGASVQPYIPDRFKEAYGLNKPALKALHDEGIGLVVTVDCGVRSRDEIAYANELGLEVVVTDHHSAPELLPPAVAVVDAKRQDAECSFRDLAGVGVAYSLVRALCDALGAAANCSPEDYLDLVALGTVADIVPLLDDNRALVHLGMERLRDGGRVGIQALMESADVNAESLDSEDIAFRLAPRLNAAGRLAHARLAYRLLSTDTLLEARQLAAQLEQINSERQSLLRRQVREAKERLGGDEAEDLLFVADADYHTGIVGLIASRLSEEFYRPALVMQRGERLTRGSARSIDEFHITHALDHCADLLTRYGGHAGAAGFELPTERLPAFRERLLDYTQARLDPRELHRVRRVDAILGLEALDMATPRALAMLEPFGEGNDAPSFASLGLKLLSIRQVGREGSHLQLVVAEGQRSLRCIAFRQGHLAEELRSGDLVDLIYRPSLNTYRGRTSLQLVVEALRPH